MAVDIGLSLGNTLLTITPRAAVITAASYKCSIGSVTDSVSQVSRDLPNDSLEFDIESPTAFDMSEVKLDNTNFQAKGSLIHAANSGGVSERHPMFNEDMAYLFSPRLLKNVKNLVLHNSSVTMDNIPKARSQDIMVVLDGKVSGVPTNH